MLGNVTVSHLSELISDSSSLVKKIEEKLQ